MRAAHNCKDYPLVSALMTSSDLSPINYERALAALRALALGLTRAIPGMAELIKRIDTAK
jgi:hypothetical protein